MAMYIVGWTLARLAHSRSNCGLFLQKDQFAGRMDMSSATVSVSHILFLGRLGVLNTGLVSKNPLLREGDVLTLLHRQFANSYVLDSTPYYLTNKHGSFAINRRPQPLGPKRLAENKLHSKA